MRIRLSLNDPLYIPSTNGAGAEEKRARYLEAEYTQKHPHLLELLKNFQDVQLFPNAVTCTTTSWCNALRLELATNHFSRFEELPEKPRSPTTAAEA